MNNRQKPKTKFTRSLWNVLSTPNASIIDFAAFSCWALLDFFFAIYCCFCLVCTFTKDNGCKSTKKMSDFNTKLTFFYFGKKIF